MKNLNINNLQDRKTNIFYRFQNTLSIEKESYFVDVRFAYEDFDEYKDEFNNEEELYCYILNKYYKSFSLRRNITPSELLNLIKKSSENDIEHLAEKYKIPYIFGYRKDEIDEDYTIEDILDESTRPYFWHCENDTYLVVYEGVEIHDEYESGILFKPIRILDYYKTSSLIDKKR